MAGQPIVAGWAYQFVAQLNFVCESWTAPVDVGRVCPAQDADEVATGQMRSFLLRCRSSREEGTATTALLFVFDAGYDPAKGSASDPIEVIENMTHETHNDAQAALHALLVGAEDCGPGAGSARVAQAEEFADLLCRVQEEIAPEAKRLLAQRVAE